MDDLKVILTRKDGKTYELDNVVQISKYDITSYISIKLEIPLSEIQNYYVINKTINKVGVKK